jgi:hypothetical protein
MNLEKLTTNCLCVSVFSFLFVFLLFKRTREGVETGSDEVSLGKNWKIKSMPPSKEQIKELQKSGQKLDSKNTPNTQLHFLYQAKETDGWKPVYKLSNEGVMEGREFKKMQA